MPIENNILQLTEHSLMLDDIVILDNESGNNNQGNVKPSKLIGSLYPFVEINKYEFAYIDIMSFELYNNGFLPTISLKVVDSDGLFQARYFALDGAIINFYIRANNEELFKPIHINFDIIRLSPAGLSPAGKPMFSITGQMKIPNLYTEFCQSISEKTSFEALQEIADNLQIGFSSNEIITNDAMTWLNPYDTTFKFIQDITAHSYKDEESYFTSFIDPYYNLTFVNINKVYENSTIDNSEIYSTQIQDLRNEDVEFDTVALFFTNLREFNNTSKYISAYRLANRTGEIFLKNGYKRTLQYFDEIANEYISEVDVMPFTGTAGDLIHLAGRFINGESEGLNDQCVKFKFMGKQNENMHDYYKYSNLLNFQNLEESNKITMEITLFQTDMSIYRYQSVLIQIFDYETMVKKIKSDHADDLEAISPDDKNTDGPILNEFLSGMYVITGMDYIYRSPGPMYQKIYLSKREFKATN